MREARSQAFFTTSIIILSVIFQSYIHAETSGETSSFSQELQEVVVTANQNLFKIKGANKFVYEVYKDSTLKGANTLDALSRVPLLAVNKTGNIEAMNGREMVFKINGLNDPLLKTLSQTLTALPADAIKTIELKEDFSGTGKSIIEVNIVTKGRLEGYRVQLNTRLSDRQWANSIWALSKVKRVTFQGGYTNRWMWGHKSTSGKEEFRLDTPDTYRFASETMNNGYKTDVHDIFLTASYDVDDKSFISFFGRAILKKDPHISQQEKTDIYNEEGQLSASYTNDYVDLMNDSEYEISVKYERDLTSDNLPGSLNIGYDFYSRPTDYNKTVKYNVIDNNLGEGLDLFDLMNSFRHSQQTYTTHTLAADWIKETTRNSQWSIYGKFRNRNEEYKNKYDLNPISGNKDPYYESYNTSLIEYWGNITPKFSYYRNDKWEVRGGAALQAYHHQLRTSGQTYKILRKRISILPFISAAIVTKRYMTLRIAYTMNEYIPDISALNPYVIRTEAGQISYGNPNLKPQISHNLGFGLNGSTGKLFSGGTINMYYKKDMSLRYSFVNEGIMNYTYGNIANCRGITFGGFTSGRVHRNTYLRFNTSLEWVQYRSAVLNQKNSGWHFNCRAYAEQELPGGITLGAEANYYSPLILLQGKSGHSFSYDINLYKQFFKRSLMVIIDADSFFPLWYIQTSSNFGPSFSSKSWNRSFHASFSLTLRYEFGKLNANVKSGSASMGNSDIKTSYSR